MTAMMKLRRLIVLSLCTYGVISASAQDTLPEEALQARNKYVAMLDRNAEKADSAKRKLREALIKALESQVSKSQKAGELKNVLTYGKRLETVKKSEDLLLEKSDPDYDQFQKRLASIADRKLQEDVDDTKSYLKYLKRKVVDHTKANKIELAVAFNTEADRVMNLLKAAKGGALGSSKASGSRPASSEKERGYGFELGHYKWYQGKPKVKIMPADDAFCVLSRIGGQFEGGGEASWLSIDKKDNHWYLQGQSNTREVQSHAISVKLKKSKQFKNSYHGKLLEHSMFSWRQGQGRVKMIHSSKGFCGLTRMGGQFEGGGEAVWLTVDKKDGFWYLHGQSGQRHVNATAVAVNLEKLTLFKRMNVSRNAKSPMELKHFTWKQGQPRVKMIHSADGFCCLTRIGGQFEGGGEAVWLTVDTNDGYWYLHGQSMQRQVNAHAVAVIMK